MKRLLILILMFPLFSMATNYYFDPAGSDANTGTSAVFPFQTIGKFNAVFAASSPGDQFLFKRGGVWSGAMIIGRSGTLANPIIIDAYGSGAKPLISGFITLGGWTLVSGNIYSASTAAGNVKKMVNLVTVNGEPVAVGRYPNANSGDGYLRYEGSDTRYDIIDNQLTTAINWAGAEVCIKKEGYILERDLVTNHAGTKLTYTTTRSINELNKVSFPETPIAGFGYFLQRDARCLDQFTEWYFDSASKSMRMDFGGNTPSSYAVRVAAIDTLVNIQDKAYVTFRNIAFEGAGMASMYAKDGNNILVDGCDFLSSGAKAVFFWNINNVTVQNCYISNSLCNGIDITGRYATNATVKGNRIRKTAVFPGMGSFYDDADMLGAMISVQKNAFIEKNLIDTVGYCGLRIQGDSITVQKNYVNYHDFVKDDGAGIYTYSDTAAKGRVIQDNIVLNGIGSLAGNAFPTHASSIYGDGGAKGIKVLRNTCAYNSDWAVYFNDPHEVTIMDNFLFSNGWNGYSNGNGGLGIQKHFDKNIYNVVFKRNIVLSPYSYQGIFWYANGGLNSTMAPVASTINQALQLVATIDSNYYMLGMAAGWKWYYQTVNGGTTTFPAPVNYATWKTTVSNVHDNGSTILPLIGADSLKLYVNPSDTTVNYPSPYTGYNYETLAPINGTVPVAPWGRALLRVTGLVPTTSNPKVRVGRIRI